MLFEPEVSPGGRHAILVVEDDPEINRLVGAYVELAHFDYVSALTGGDALAQVRKHPPLAIVLDLMLPDVSGLELCRQLKADASTRKIPIIILTALDTEDTKAQGFRSGASAYLTKPFDPDQLLEALGSLAATTRGAELASKN